MRRTSILLLAIPLLLGGCGSSKPVATTSTLTKKENKKAQAQVMMDENGDWVLNAPNGQKVAKVYVPQGSSMADRFHEGYIRIVSDDGLKIGFANQDGEIVVKPCYLSASPFTGPIAAVTPFAEISAASATDDAAIGELTGEELWGVIDKNGMMVRKPSYRRRWDDAKSCYVYTSTVSRFYITDEGEMVNF